MQTALGDQQARPMIVRERIQTPRAQRARQLLLLSCACCALGIHASGMGQPPWQPVSAQRALPASPTNNTSAAASSASAGTAAGLPGAGGVTPGGSAGASRDASLGCGKGWWSAWARPGCHGMEAEDDSEAAPKLLRRRAMGEALIPHIIHQVFLDGEAALAEEERKEERAGREFRRFNHRWRNSCQKWHPGWQHMFWDAERAEALLAARYAWFLPTWHSYPRIVHKGDAIRPFLLDAYGGLYMDVDVECFDSAAAMVDGFDLVLQLEDAGNKSLNNAVMAGAPGLELWGAMQRLLAERAPHLVAMHNKTRSQRDMSHAVLFATGPWLLRDAFKAVTGEAGALAVGYAGEHSVKGTRIMVYALGQWFEPCEWSDLSCHALVDIAAEAGTPLTGIVGHHKNAGTWLKGYAEAEAGAAAASPYLGTALRGLRLRLRHETWPTLGMGAALLLALAALLCWRLLRRRRWGRWRGGNVANLRLGGPGGGAPSWGARPFQGRPFRHMAGSVSCSELSGLERRAAPNLGAWAPSLGAGATQKPSPFARSASHQKLQAGGELDKGEP